MPSIRVMIVDDHEVVRSGLKAILEPEGDLDVVGEASTAMEAVQRVPHLEPHVILMDVRMEWMSGIEACRMVKNAHPEVNVLMLTSYGEEEAVMSAIVAGASGYLLKNVGRADLVRAIHVVAQGENLLDAAVTRRIMERLVATNRQLEALNKKIQEELNLLFGTLSDVIAEEEGRLEHLAPGAVKDAFLRCLRRIDEVISHQSRA